MPVAVLIDYDSADAGFKHRYRLTVNGGTTGSGRGGFSKISGIRAEIEVVDKRDGTDPVRSRKLVGTHSGSDCTLEKGVFSRKTFIIQWFKDTKSGINGFYKRSVIIEVFGIDGEIKRTVTLFDAWPHSYELGELDGKSADVAVESLVLAFEDMDIK